MAAGVMADQWDTQGLRGTQVSPAPEASPEVLQLPGMADLHGRQRPWAPGVEFPIAG